MADRGSMVIHLQVLADCVEGVAYRNSPQRKSISMSEDTGLGRRNDNSSASAIRMR